MYLEKKEEILNNKYLKKGYLVQPVANLDSFKKINEIFFQILKKKINPKLNYATLLNNTHKLVKILTLPGFNPALILSLSLNKPLPALT